MPRSPEAAPARTDASRLRLRPPRTDDEATVRRAQQAMAAEDFVFAPGLEARTGWSDHLRGLDHLVTGPRSEGVRATFLVAEVNGEIVGRTSIRFALDEFLAREGGHIGYCVLPHCRRRGYATEILPQSLVVARAEGVHPVLVVCQEDNLGSATVIESCGGQWESTVHATDGTRLRRYWIT